MATTPLPLTSSSARPISGRLTFTRLRPRPGPLPSGTERGGSGPSLRGNGLPPPPHPLPTPPAAHAAQALRPLPPWVACMVGFWARHPVGGCAGSRRALDSVARGAGHGPGVLVWSRDPPTHSLVCTPSEWVFPTPSDSTTGRPAVHLDPDAIYMEIASDPTG